MRGNEPQQVARLAEEFGLKRAGMLRVIIRFALAHRTQLRAWYKEMQETEMPKKVTDE